MLERHGGVPDGVALRGGQDLRVARASIYNIVDTIDTLATICIYIYI